MNFFDIWSNGFFLTQSISMTDATRSVLLAIGVLLSMAASYLLGSVNFAIIISSRQYHEDIRDYGSKNAGMTNMMRTYGKKAAALTLGGDALKAILASIIGRLLLGGLGAYIAALFCVIGHMFPIFYGFRGGKGVVTVAAAILMCDPLVFAILFVIFAILVLGTKYLSFGSIMCMILYPFLLDRMTWLLYNHPNPYQLFAVGMAILVVAKHRENITRLLKGEERKFSFKKSKKPDEASDDSIKAEKK